MEVSPRTLLRRFEYLARKRCNSQLIEWSWRSPDKSDKAQWFWWKSLDNGRASLHHEATNSIARLEPVNKPTEHNVAVLFHLRIRPKRQNEFCSWWASIYGRQQPSIRQENYVNMLCYIIQYDYNIHFLMTENQDCQKLNTSKFFKHFNVKSSCRCQGRAAAAVRAEQLRLS